MSVRHAELHYNPFLTAPIGRLFWANALPMAVVMSMGGILNVVDGVFVGRLVGPQALAAVSMAFPVTMVVTALATLVGGGMSSLMARQLGAGDRAAAGRAFAGAHGLVLAISAGAIFFWELAGKDLAHVTASEAGVADLLRDYLCVLVWGVPVQLLLSLHADALRNEGRAGVIAGLSVLVNLANIAMNWLGIVVLELGIAGSALGTVAAQGIGLALLILLRAGGSGLLPLSVLRASWRAGWWGILRLGLPLCLAFLGIAVSASVVMLALHLRAGADYGPHVAGYGVVTRLLGLAFLPQMAIALATQSLSGNNVGAGRSDRARSALRLAMAAGFVWCFLVALTGLLGAPALAGWFTDDPAVKAAVVQILRPMMLVYVASGPVLALALHFQAINQPGRTAVLTLVKPWLLLPGLALGLSWSLGAPGIWLAFPIADAIVLALALAIGRHVLTRVEGRA